MIRARVPEAAVHEDRKPRSREHDIRPNHPSRCADRVVLAEAETAPMQRGPEPDLGLRTRPLVAPHHRGSGSGGWRWVTVAGCHASSLALRQGGGWCVRAGFGCHWKTRLVAEDEASVANRVYGRIYRVRNKAAQHAMLLEAVEASGGRVLYASAANRAPIFVGVAASDRERLGVLCYPFRASHDIIKNRPTDEHRVQMRYGSEASWLEDHPVAQDVAGVDATVILGVHLDAGIFVGLDPLIYDPLPLGGSVEFKDGDVQKTVDKGWHVWQRVNRPGSRREKPKAVEGVETVVGFRPERLLDYVRLEREATSLGLDPPLRYRAAVAAGREAHSAAATAHAMEEEFEVDAQRLLDIIQDHKRLKIAVRGSVAEYHLVRELESDPGVSVAEPIDQDGPPDVRVTMRSGRTVEVECKNVNPTPTAKGLFRADVQKTRASKADPASRYYDVGQFEVLAASLFPATGKWEFRYRRADRLEPHALYPGKIAAAQKIDDSWSTTLAGALG
jgi:hypothetical protein